MEQERCFACGEIIPEGRHLCRGCAKEHNIKSVGGEAAEELRDIAQVLNITASTDKNIQSSMEAILRIAERLGNKERKPG